MRLVRLTCSESARLEREALRADRDPGISAFTAENEVTDLPFDLVVDTSDITAEEAAREIIRHTEELA